MTKNKIEVETFGFSAFSAYLQIATVGGSVGFDIETFESTARIFHQVSAGVSSYHAHGYNAGPSGVRPVHEAGAGVATPTGTITPIIGGYHYDFINKAHNFNLGTGGADFGEGGLIVSFPVNTHMVTYDPRLPLGSVSSSKSPLIHDMGWANGVPIGYETNAITALSDSQILGSDLLSLPISERSDAIYVQQTTGYTVEQQSANYREKIAASFDKVDSAEYRDAVRDQYRTFEREGYSPDEIEALIDFRDAYKRNDSLVDESARLADLGVSVPDPENEVWSFCFAGDTLISMADGSQKRIDEVEVGDKVLAFSEDDQSGQGALVPRTVTRLFQKVTGEWLKLSNGVTVTPGHFFLTTDGTYEPISQILEKRGGQVVLEDGSVEVLNGERIKFSEETADQYPHREHLEYPSAGGVALEPKRTYGWSTYNFEVDDYPHGYRCSRRWCALGWRSATRHDPKKRPLAGPFCFGD